MTNEQYSKFIEFAKKEWNKMTPEQREWATKRTVALINRKEVLTNED